jgi:superfamily II DNA or RNA helicase
MPSDSELLAIATGQYLGEGFDCPQVDTLFLAFPLSFKGKLVQYVGRVLRSHEGKSSARVYDYVDTQVAILRKMYAKR